MDNRAFLSSSQDFNMADTKETFELRKNSKITPNYSGGRKRYFPLKFLSLGNLKPRSLSTLFLQIKRLVDYSLILKHLRALAFQTFDQSRCLDVLCILIS